MIFHTPKMCDKMFRKLHENKENWANALVLVFAKTLARMWCIRIAW